MIYTVIAIETGDVVGASATDWFNALRDAFGSSFQDIEFAFCKRASEHADGFALHGYRLRVMEAK